MATTLRSTDLRLILSVAFITVAAIAATWFGLREFDRQSKINYANHAAAFWRHHLVPRLDSLEDSLDGKPLLARDKRLLDYTLMISGGHRYSLFNAKGVVVGASRRSDLGKKIIGPVVLAALAKGEPVTRIFEDPAAEVRSDVEKTGQIRHHSDYAGGLRVVTETFIPLLKGGRFLGAIAIYSDRTRNVALTRRTSGYLKIGLIAVYLVLSGVLGFLVIQNHRTRYTAAKVRAAGHSKTKAALEKAVRAEVETRNANLEVKEIERRLVTAQNELARVRRIATVGQLTSAVVHELRNPLGAVRTAAYLIDRKTRDQGLGVEKSLERVNNGIKRCESIVTKLLDVTTNTELQPEKIKLDDWVRSVVNELEVPREVTVAYDLNLGNRVVDFDPERLRRAVANMIANAVEAMVGPSGQNTFDGAEPHVVVCTAVDAGRITLSIIDNGPGIPPETLARVHEPLFSTKDSGAGLGVPAILQVMERHGGGFEIRSQEGKGTTATAWFPIHGIAGQSEDAA